MATVEDYKSGRVVEGVRRIMGIIDASSGSIKDSKTGGRIVEEMQRLDPVKLSPEEASRLVQEAGKCAVGERVCRALDKSSPLTESVFLDELAEGMVEAEKASYVTKDEAMSVLRKFPGHPIVATRVSGKHAEICNTWPRGCIYWKLEKCGLRCIGRIEEAE